MEEKRNLKKYYNDSKQYECVLKCAYISYLIKSDKFITDYDKKIIREIILAYLDKVKESL